MRLRIRQGLLRFAPACKPLRLCALQQVRRVLPGLVLADVAGGELDRRAVETAHSRGHSPGAEIGEKARVGNFVEVKKARLGKGAKANHLSYIGDADIGEDTNIAASNVTVNFPHQPGRPKGRTTIGRNVRTGVDNAFVAPVTIGDDAWIGAAEHDVLAGGFEGILAELPDHLQHGEAGLDLREPAGRRPGLARPGLRPVPRVPALLQVQRARLQHRSDIDAVPDDFLVISGDDMITLPMILAGGSGVISVIAQGFPAQFSKMVKLGLEGKSAEAFKIHHKIAPAIDMIFAEGNPAGIKAVLTKLDLCQNELRLPLVPVSKELENELSGFIKVF